MNDPALYGNCLSCGKTAYAQSYCDGCSEGKTYICEECDEEFEKQYSECRDHQMDELREEVTNLKDRLEKAESRARYKEATIKELLDGLDSLRKSVNAERGR